MSWPVYAAEKIKDIIYKGNERVSKETIFAYLDVNKGDTIDQTKIDTSIKSLYNTGFFSDIKISSNNGILEVTVVENPMINKIAFDGNKKLEDSDLLNELSMKPHTIFSPTKMQSDINKILKAYQNRGRYSAKVEPKVIKLDQNRISLIYEINEGPEAVIQKIIFTGNENFSDSTLADVIVSKEHRWYRFFSSADVFDPEKQKFDQELLRRFYTSKGFAAFKVTSSVSELSPDKEAFILTFVVDEGDVYKYGKVSLDNKIKNLNNNTLHNLITIKTNSIFNMEELDNTVDNLTNYLGEHGFPFVDIDYDITTHKDTLFADVTFIIKESFKVYVRKISIKNNTRTLDKVIRREFRISEGDPYNVSKIQRSKQRIENLGYFSKVDFKNKKTNEPDKIDVDVDVEETSTGSINFAAGYNTVSGIMGSITLSEDNFLGKGQQVQLGLTQAQKERLYEFSFTEPYFMDKELSAGFEIFSTQRDLEKQSSFKSKSIGIGLLMGYNLTEHLSHGWHYRLKKEDIYDIKTDSIYIKSQQGKRTASIIGHTLVYDRLDSKIDPTDGYIIKFTQDLAGLGGQVRYISHDLMSSYYKPIYKKEVILKLVARGGNIAGYGDKPVFLANRFSLGPDEIRGFESGGIGARDKKTNDALGGNSYYAGTAEMTFPLGLPKEVDLKGGIFIDAASLFGIDEKDKSHLYYSESLRASYGASLYWKSPIGDIGAHYGVPFKKEKFDDTQNFYLSFGKKF